MIEGINLEQAIEILLSKVKPIADVEEVPLFEAVGRVAAENISAEFDNPPFARSPLDGYALNSADTPGKLKIVGEECAGEYFSDKLNRGEALRIMTGAAMPEGSDCVVRQEDVTVNGEEVFVPFKLNHHENYCFAGEDVKAGITLIDAGQKLSAAHVGVLASQGFIAVKVFRRPKVALASTGDELILPGEKLSGGKIYNSNLYFLTARLCEMKIDCEILGILPDDADKISEVIAKTRADIFITTGGVSVGKKDVMHEVVAKVGEKLFWRVLMKPGAPAIGCTVGKMLGLALSGNPFAAYATFELLARPVLKKIARREDLMYKRGKGILMNDFPKVSKGRRFIRARHVDGEIFLPAQHASGSLFSAANCNAFVDIPAGTDKISAGSEVEVVFL